MAERLDDFPKGHERHLFPIDEWTDGSTWKLTRGADFEQDVARMRTLLYAAARRRGMRLQSRSVRENDREQLIVRFTSAEAADEPAKTTRARRGG